MMRVHVNTHQLKNNNNKMQRKKSNAKECRAESQVSVKAEMFVSFNADKGCEIKK